MRSGSHSYIGTVEALRARCRVDPQPGGCWHYLGASGSDGVPRVHTFDHARGEKRTMSGPKAAWNIAHGAAPLPGWLVMRRCGTRDCLNPVHLREVANRKAMGEHIRLAGFRVGNSVKQRRANIRLAMLASGVVPTPEHIVLAIRSAPASMKPAELARIHGLKRTTVSHIRTGRSHKHIQLEAAA